MYVKKFVFLIFCLLFLIRTQKIFAQLYIADANGDGKVNGSDYVIWLTHYGQLITGGASIGDFNNSGKVDGADYTVWLTHYGKQVLASSSNQSTDTPSISSRMGPNMVTMVNELIITFDSFPPWKFMWEWNGAGSDGKKQSSHLAVVEQVQPITGGGRVYMIAGNQVNAINKATGAVIWTRGSIGTLTGTPAYDSEFLFVPSSDGHIYKLNAQTGAISSSFTGSGSFKQAVLISNGVIYAPSLSGSLYAISTATMSQNWVYSAGSPLVTTAAISPSRSLVIVNSQDLYVHAVNSATGQRVWRVKPTGRTYQSGNPNSSGAQFEYSWPVIAESHGVVFVRYRLDWDTIWTWSPFPTTNAQIRANFLSKPDQQALYALKLSDGSQAFIANVGNGGQGDGGYLEIGPMPVIRVVDGQEVAYIIWRNGLTCPTCDGREDANMGEMVLDSTTVSGYQAGDVRFVHFEDIQTDEMMPISMGGDVLFHSHWLVNEAYKITNRVSSLGATFSNPIQTTVMPYVIWRQCNQTNFCYYPGCTTNLSCGVSCPVSSSRYCSNGLFSYGDTRSYPPGFYEYNNDYNDGTWPITVVNNDQILVKLNDGGIMALTSGNPTAEVKNTPQIASKQTTTDVLGATYPSTLSYTQASKHIGEFAVFKGVIKSVVNHLPKALYLGFTDHHDVNLLVRIFAKYLSKFTYDPQTLLGKEIEVRGIVTLYWPEAKDPEIIVSSPEQIRILN